jgi:hypothetical protein
VRTAAALRIVFIAVALVVGLGLAAASLLGTWELIQSSMAVVEQPLVEQQPDGSKLVTDPGGPDDTPPFSFLWYGYAPVIAVIVLFSGFAALKHRWQALALTCWFLLGAALLDALLAISILVVLGSTPDSLSNVVDILWMVFPLCGLLLAATARSSETTVADRSSAISSHEKIRLRNTLVGLAALGYLWRAVTLVLNPGAVTALAYFRGTTDIYLILSSILGVAGSLVLLCAIAFFKGNERLITAALALTAGVALEGFLHALDLALNFATGLEVVYALQDAVAFAACCAALAVSGRPRSLSSPLAT